ncbi:glycosyltransferase family 2 protein [Chromobacterium subtsugae]|uniref:Glycosyltransferase family 2 protein n=1 Tax=Chromobacterium subtsugae TaxID=251747 RepID=A0ABS7FFT5_9NEIS|nr:MULTISPECIES: glycosyltransferase family 2 protein [Chromobacterium]MBW7567703.1 glycosyltransferase family 2 protein [Chromobacterium subtsugae]MBW8288929.1 glycosyltransferase family 2 protein [Chromobacterium subtsugae]WSE91278.1 glycosyltransferase family 2 protein [Chromobacterium subtsugae]WVH59653.1 glycosyltransferase family 2 protein [Chromobacterium subtsugae]
MRLSVIISTLSRKETLVRLLENISRQTRLPEEIVIVEAGSGNLGPSDIPVSIRELIVTIYPYQASLAYSRESGRKTATGDVIVFFDDDIIIPNTYIEDVASYMLENQDIMGVGGTYTDENVTKRVDKSLWVGRLLGIYADGHSNRILKSGWADYVRSGYLNDITPAQWLFGCNGAYRADAFKVPSVSIQKDMATWSFLEDAVLGAMLTRNYGMCLRILPTLAVRHAPPASFGSINKSTLRMRILYRYIFWRDFLDGVCTPSLPAFLVGMVANLLLMLKQERALWVAHECFQSLIFIYRNPKISWQHANDFIFGK